MLTVFQNGQPGSRQATMAALNSVRDQGTSVLNALESSYTENLVALERRLSAVNARRQLANRIPVLRELGKLNVTDFIDIDQANTTATVRIDSQSATLRERNQASPSDIGSIGFSTDIGSVATLGSLYQVHISDGSGSTPTGSFLITLDQPLAVTMLVFDILATPSQPAITVETSTDGITYASAAAINLSGYRVSAYFPAPVQAKYIKISIVPSHPDNLGGDTFTFGILDFNSASVQFQLLSELISRPILISPASPSLYFVADADPGISFFISIGGLPFVEVVSGGIVAIPGASAGSLTSVGMQPATLNGELATTLPANLYPSSLNITDSTSGFIIPWAPGLPAGSAGLSSQYMASPAVTPGAPQNLFLTPFNATPDAGRTFDVSYACGPATVQVLLRVQFLTEDRATTPVFRGASFQEN